MGVSDHRICIEKLLANRKIVYWVKATFDELYVSVLELTLVASTEDKTFENSVSTKGLMNIKVLLDDDIFDVQKMNTLISPKTRLATL